MADDCRNFWKACGVSCKGLCSCLPCSIFKTKEINEEELDAQFDGLKLTVRANASDIEKQIPSTADNERIKIRSWSNAVKTGQYTWWSFLPLNLVQQCLMPANMYFLIMAALQLIPVISDSGGVPTFLIPIAVVFVVTMIKDGYEEIVRHRFDRDENQRPCRRVTPNATLEEVHWQDLHPGDIVHLKANDAIPADMVLLTCSDAFGISYVETAQLDGETNLKNKTCIPEILSSITSVELLADCKIELTFPPPTVHIYQFFGTLRLYQNRPPPISPAVAHPRLTSLTRRVSSKLIRNYHHETGSRTRAATQGSQFLGEPWNAGTAPRDVPGQSGLLDIQAAKGSGRRRFQSADYPRIRDSTEPEAITPASQNAGAPSLATASPKVDPGTALLAQGQRNDESLAGSFAGAGHEEFALSIAQFLWRGASLRNTTWAVGVVVYTGHNTRIFKNSKSRSLKHSQLLKIYNRHAIWLFIGQFLCCLIAGFVFAASSISGDDFWFLDPSSDEIEGNSNGQLFMNAFGVTIGRFLLLLSYFVPITLFVQLEIVKAFEAWLFNRDRRMYSDYSERFAAAQATSLMEELGCVTHIFSDKTGTLTMNVMQFRSVGIGDVLYGEDEQHGSPTADKVVGLVAAEEAVKDPKRSPNAFVNFDAIQFRERLTASSEEYRKKAADFLKVLALCHSVLPKDASLLGDFDIVNENQKVSSSRRRGNSSMRTPRVAQVSNIDASPTMVATPDNLHSAERDIGSSAPPGSSRGEPIQRASAPSTSSESISPIEEVVNEQPPSPPSSRRADRRYYATEDGRDGSPSTARSAVSSSSSSAISQYLRGTGPYRVPPAPIVDPFATARGRQPQNSTPIMSSRFREAESKIPSGMDWLHTNVAEHTSARGEADGLSPAANLITSQMSTSSRVRLNYRVRPSDSTLSLSRTWDESRMELDGHDEEGEVWWNALQSPLLAEGERLHSSSPPTQEQQDPDWGDTPVSPRQWREMWASFGGLSDEWLGAGDPRVRGSSVPYTGRSFVERDEEERCHSEGVNSQNRETAMHFRDENKTFAAPVSPPRNMELSGWRRRSSSKFRAKNRLGLLAWKTSGDSNVNFDASSPDELALVCGAKHLGVEFVKRPDLSSIQICLTAPICEELFLTPDEKEELGRLKAVVQQEMGAELERDGVEPKVGLTYSVLEMLDFDNIRKRMGTIIRDRDGTIKLLLKGADSSMIAVARVGQDDLKHQMQSQLDRLASEGLRTLVFGFKDIPSDVYSEWKAKLDEAKKSTSADRDDEIRKCYEEIEEGIEIAGCTGIDDKLQDQVPETINDIKAAGVKLWVLTGDKLETAISIGHSCNILTADTYNARLTGTTPAEVLSQLKRYMGYLVAGQLSQEAFTQLRTAVAEREEDAHSEGHLSIAASRDENFDIDDARDDEVCCTCCGPSCKCGRNETVGERVGCRRGFVNTVTLKPLRKKKTTNGDRKPKSGRSKAPQMTWEDFVAVLTFQARHQKVAATSGKKVVMTDEEVEALIEQYVRVFDRPAEKRGFVSTVLETVVPESNLPPKEHAPTIVVHPPSGIGSEGNARLDVFGAGGGVGRNDGYGDRSAVVVGGSGISVSDDDSHSKSNSVDARSPSTEARVQRTRGETGEALHSDEGGGACSLEEGNPKSRKGITWGESVVGGEGIRKVTSMGAGNYVEEYRSLAITCTGDALRCALADDECTRYFFGLASLCDTVICCRVTPKQKAQVVSQCTQYTPGKMVSLGIGDGANDVNMILTADVGVGIAGKEGLQAVRSSDFAVGEFKFLRNMLFAHGHENLRKNSIHVYHTLFKNVFFGVCDFFFGFQSMFSAVDIFNSWIKQLLNVLYLPIPLVLHTIFDRQLPYDILMRTPTLYPIYTRPDNKLYYGNRWFISWFAYALLCAVCSVYFPLQAFSSQSNRESGGTPIDIWVYGTVVFTLVILIGNLTLVPFINSWFWFTFGSIALVFLFWYLTWILCPMLPDSLGFCVEMIDSIKIAHTAGNFYFAAGLTLVFTCGLVTVWWFYRTMFLPKAPTLIRERLAKGVFDVVVAVQKDHKAGVVVPRGDEDAQWRGYAFSEGVATRLTLYRRRARKKNTRSAMLHLRTEETQMVVDEEDEEMTSDDGSDDWPNEDSSDNDGRRVREEPRAMVDRLPLVPQDEAVQADTDFE